MACLTISSKLFLTQSNPCKHKENNPGSEIIPCFTTSAKPEINSTSGKVFNNCGSASTSLGGWNEPIKFFPSGRSNPVLPPSEASTIESRVVGTVTQLIPRIYVE